jgi:hypothetical protein
VFSYVLFRERSYFHSIALGCPHCIILSVSDSCRDMEEIKFEVSQLPSLASYFDSVCVCVCICVCVCACVCMCVCVCERERDRERQIVC